MTSGNQELFTFDPYTLYGEPIFFNWLNATVSEYDGWENSKNKPGVAAGIFQQIEDDDLATERPIIKHGKNSTDSPEKIFVSTDEQINYLFEHTYEDRKRWEVCWRGYYSNKNWYQYFNCAVYNTETAVYPFATKGISLRLRVPAGSNETNFGGKGDGKNYGNHCQINQAHGLWVDLEGKYHIYKMECYGDNRYLAIYGDEPRPKDGHIYEEGGSWMGDRYFFLEQPDPPVGYTSKHMAEKIVGRGKNKSVVMFTNEKKVENLFFCGFSLDIHHDRSAGSKRNYSYLISRVTPIPFYSPRHDPKVKAVLGEPTELEELKQGHKKLHFWDPPQEYYDWTDDIQYETTVDTVPEGDDTLDLAEPPPDPGGDIIEPSSIFVNEQGDGMPIPADFDLDQYLEDLADELNRD